MHDLYRCLTHSISTTVNLFVLTIASFQAYKARDIHTEFSEATYIGLAMFTLCQAYLSGVPIVAVVRNIPVAFYLVLTFLIFLLCMAVILFIFVPKVSLQKKYTKLSRKEQRDLMASKLKQSMSSGTGKPQGDSNTQHNANTSAAENPQRIPIDSNETASSQLNDLPTGSQRKAPSESDDERKYISAELRMKMSESSSVPHSQLSA